MCRGRDLNPNLTEIQNYCIIVSMNQVTQKIIKVQPRGIITIPRKFRDADFDENSFVRIRKEKRTLVIEPVQVVGYSARSYTNREVTEFFELDDQETKKLKTKGIL